MRLDNNIAIAASNSGKLSSSLYTTFFSHSIKLYVGMENFFCLIYTSGGHTNLDIYYEIFFLDENKTTRHIKKYDYEILLN